MNDPKVSELLVHRGQIESSVSDYLGRRWGITEIQDLAEKASHPSAILSDGCFRVFAKLGSGARAEAQFRCEVLGLSAMAQLADVLTPSVIDCFAIHKGSVLVLEAVSIVDRGVEDWREIGYSLAQLHAVKGAQFGFEHDGYWGNFRQNNRPLDDWHVFFWQRWIEPRIACSVDSGHLPIHLAKDVERLFQRVETLCGQHVQPSLLHGDAHQNNILSTPRGAVIIDPNIHYGHPELDLAFVDYFQPVSDNLFRAYEERLPISDGFLERRNLWRLPFYLAMVENRRCPTTRSYSKRTR